MIEQENLPIIVERLKRYLSIYRLFLITDLYISLRPKLNYNSNLNSFEIKDGGRNIPILTYLFDLFQSTMKPDNDNDKLEILYIKFENMLEDFMLNMEKDCPELMTHKNYIDFKNKTIVFNESILQDFISNKENVSALVYLFTTTNRISEKIKSSKVLESRVMEFHRVIEHQKIIYNIQALNEFNNAMSHLLFASLQVDDKLGNLQKSITHIHRGTLDIVKNFIQFITLKEKSLDAYIIARYFEFDTMGNNVSEYEKEFVLFQYLQIIDNL